jgi:catechol 2,3-dioxygenase-like lactoylglutathione lyase family enzyme
MRVEGFESVIFYVSNLKEARGFYVGFLGLPILFEDEIVVVLGGAAGRVVLHRNDKGHDERGIFPAGSTASGTALRLNVADPEVWEAEARSQGITVLWPAQEALWGRFTVLQDPDGRPVALARMRGASQVQPNGT